MLSDLKSLPIPLSITLGDGRKLQATGQGKVVLMMNLPQGNSESCTLHDVLLVPGLAYNLLSMTAASRRRKVTTFTEVGCEIRDLSSKLIASGHREGNLYYLDQRGSTHQACVSHESKEVICHRRLGHLGSTGMEALAKQQMVDGLDINLTQPPKFCESCAKGKGHRLPFKGTSGKKADHPLDLVHSDVCGKIGTKSLSGGEYFVTFIDDHTRHVWVFVLKHKHEVFACFKQWKAQVERSTGRQVKTLRSDNGGEYTSKEFALYLAKEGIKHELTTPHTPQQNGVAERLNRTLVEGVRAMLADSKLTHRFWAEALSTMAYLRNRSPTKALGGVTPHEAWSGSKPILLGYGTEQKGYRLFDPQRSKVIHSRDVVFDENSMAGDQLQVQPSSEYVNLEVESERGEGEEEQRVEVEGERGEVQEEQRVEVEGERGEVQEEQRVEVEGEEGAVQEEQRVEVEGEQNVYTSDPAASTGAGLRRSARIRQEPDRYTSYPAASTGAGLRRSARIRQEPDRYSHLLMLLSSEQQDPCSVAEAKSSYDHAKWVEAMERDSTKSGPW